MQDVRGSCLCGEVVWEAAGPLELMHHCHCSICRKTHGAAFETAVGAPVAGFRWISGEDRIARYTSSPGFDRTFCNRCGSCLPGDAVDGRVFMPVGCLDGDPGVRAAAHIFAASKAPWHEITDALPRFDAYPPGFGEAREGPKPELPRRGAAAGSCLCGAVAYELDGPLELMVNCHCSRCRKARAAAHSTQILAPARALRWLRGEERLRRYKVPDSQRFENVFCDTCGSILPHVDVTRERAIVPAGTLDGDPGAREKLHIFVGSKAPWHEITDSLPQFEEFPPGT